MDLARARVASSDEKTPGGSRDFCSLGALPVVEPAGTHDPLTPSDGARSHSLFLSRARLWRIATTTYDVCIKRLWSIARHRSTHTDVL